MKDLAKGFLKKGDGSISCEIRDRFPNGPFRERTLQK